MLQQERYDRRHLLNKIKQMQLFPNLQNFAAIAVFVS